MLFLLAINPGIWGKGEPILEISRRLSYYIRTNNFHLPVKVENMTNSIVLTTVNISIKMKTAIAASDC
ncbi:hypothetical protein F7734_21055 [Scytonema sp. UIC 10036]|uniref:hypothetical protein n=1 Tax=Scytonema sp. UIC 10036 TaxID=2304196 RepID=UPI0012DAADF1|nr:hypothetical protein [Scytonema sp. UIC 10036]MUG94717.1 hypothetical protein [Scytonema sp. UIC 10036]